MGTVYPRGRWLWINFKDESGERCAESSGCLVGEEDKARKVLERIEARIKAGLAFDSSEKGPITVQRYAERWLEDRRKRKPGGAKTDAGRLKKHALKEI